MNNFDSLKRLVRGYADATDVAAALGCCYNTAADRMKHPEDFTLGELAKLSKKFRISTDEIRNAVRFY